ncbi:MAG: UDP-N-acetylglucosamine:undecaprenyl-P N-acetylglucosaminyl 1-P transferase [Candidatus Berkelbacteria bacterium Gr01-1014_85]|uniref:UDP-N-acetylglucosamine:undecaprenyl-P N-acetylglucosaminyl 1-P transferase n=1 Tax=Candidatus Berkelbacteria bacterium Gr01-1014_85 TaxID=2017150 RepID=A0A554J9I7_9BACT|nr:MAG: UDP-N-acetylglucosamine:undecaprenyl-P N-acetylglucosaminyl 1-P transferase [Candidatus Berkelbacteria bacterium Gr01-1014_85]
MTNLWPILGLAGVATTLISLLLTPLIRQLAWRYQIVDQPLARRVNTEPIPRLGGVAVVVSFWLLILALSLLMPEWLNFTTERRFGFDANLFGLALGTLVIVTTGVLDDLYSLKPWQKLLAQFIAAAILPLCGVRIGWLAHPLGGPDIQLMPWLDAGLIIAWLVLLINVTNWLDGLDGLVTGIGIIALACLGILASGEAVGQLLTTSLLAWGLAASLLGFLPWNLYPAKIFLGDTGSMFIGYLIGALAIFTGGKLATASLIMAIPILDALFVIVRRLIEKRSPWLGDRGHLHHRLYDLGLTQRQTVSLYWLIALLLGIAALANRTLGKTQLLLATVLLFSMLWLGLRLTEIRRSKLLAELQLD